MSQPNLSMWDLEDKFFLIDVEKVIYNEPIQIREPEGLRDLELTIERPENDRGGAIFEYGAAESELGFDLYKGLIGSAPTKSIYQAINQLEIEKGTDALLRFEHYNNDNLVFQADVVISSKREVDVLNYFRVKRITFGEKFRSRYDTVTTIAEPVDLDGNQINEIELDSITMHGQLNVDTGTKTVFNSEEFNELPTLPTLQGQAYVWGTVPFNQTTKRLDNLFDYGTLVYNSEVSTPSSSDVPQEVFVDTNPLWSNQQYQYKAEIPSDVRLTYGHEYNLSTSYAGPNFTPLFYAVSIWVVSQDGVLREFDDVYFLDQTPFAPIPQPLDLTFDKTYFLNTGDQIYYAWRHRFFGSLGFDLTAFSQQALTGVFQIKVETLVQTSPAKGLLLKDAVERLMQKAIGITGQGEGLLTIDTLDVELPALITGQTNGATAKPIALNVVEGQNVYSCVDMLGDFVTGEDVVAARLNGTTIYTATLTSGQSGGLTPIVQSNLLDIGGCANLQFVTDGQAIRGFLPDEYDANLYYQNGDKVTFNTIQYEYINESITQGNAPPDALYWREIKSRGVLSSLEKLIGFIQTRYNAGIALARVNGTDFGTNAQNKITRLIIEPVEYFFTDTVVLELTLDQVDDDIQRSINKALLFNQIESGYAVYSDDDEQDSFRSFNTLSEHVTPIRKDRKKLELVADVCMDGYAFEDLRRKSIVSDEDKSNKIDDETCIIDLYQITDTTPAQPSLYGDDSDLMALAARQAQNQIDVIGVISVNVTAGHKINFKDAGNNDQTLDITSVIYDYANNRMVLSVSPFAFAIDPFGDFWFGDSGNTSLDNVYMPRRLESITDIAGVPDIRRQYNLVHAPTSILIENYSFYGSTMQAKSGQDKVLFTSGKNNNDLTKRDSTTCTSADQVIAESQDFELSVLRTLKPELFTLYKYDISASLDFNQFEELRKSMIGESNITNFGCIQFVDNLGKTVKAAPITIKYNPLTLSVDIECWELNATV